MTEPSDPTSPQGPVVKELSGRIGKYEIVKPLGKGAMGMVYLAHDTMLERDVALKVMVAAIADDPELKKRFEREAKAVAKMTHPNVVMVFDLGYHTDGSPYLAMELLKGQDLQKAVRTPPPLSLDRKVAIILQTLAGLSHAHQAGIVHRDIKPANIFIGLDGSVKIMDFGVARLTTASMTGTGNIVGTADYMSPEQVKGAKVDGRSDLFSVGCMLYELLAGRRPFHSDNLMAIFYKITHEEPNWDLIPSGAEYDALMPVVKKALAKNLEDRYQSAYEFAGDLKEYLRTHATSASGERVLQELSEIEAPPTTPPAIIGETDEGGETEITVGTMDLKPSTGARTRRGGGTTMRGAAPTVLAKPGARPAGARRGAGAEAPTRLVPRAAPPPSRAPLYAGLGVVLAAAVAGGLYFGVIRQPQPVTPSAAPTAVPTAPPPTAAPATPVPTAAPPPPTPAPKPKLAETRGRGAAQMKAAQAAFDRGDYDTAIARAQEALKADSSNASAKTMLDNALNGQRAEARFRAAQTALGSKDFDKAMAEANAGRQLAPWDRRATDLIGRIQDAQAQARAAADRERKRQLAAQMNDLLSKAENATEQGKYDAAIALYDEVLKIDPQNARAGIGRANAVGAKAMAKAAAGARPGPHVAQKSFSAGKTTATSKETRAGNLPPGFEDTPGVKVERGTQAADLPGKVLFDVNPDSPKAGDKYTVVIKFENTGAAPIQIASMIVTTTVNGKTARGPVPPQVKDVAPRDTATLLQIPDYWRDDISSWTMQVAVNTTRGETYINKVTWK